MSTGDSFGYRWGRNDELCVGVGPRDQDCWHADLSRLTAFAVNLSRRSGRRGLYASYFGCNSRRLRPIPRLLLTMAYDFFSYIRIY